MSKKPRLLGEVRRRDGSRPIPGAIVKQTLRDLLALRYGRGQIGGKRISNLTQAEMVALLTARGADIHDPETGWLLPEIIAEAAEMMADIPSFPPSADGIEVMPDGRWARTDDAEALRDLSEQADASARLHDAREAFR